MNFFLGSSPLFTFTIIETTAVEPCNSWSWLIGSWPAAAAKEDDLLIFGVVEHGVLCVDDFPPVFVVFLLLQLVLVQFAALLSLLFIFCFFPPSISFAALDEMSVSPVFSLAVGFNLFISVSFLLVVVAKLTDPGFPDFANTDTLGEVLLLSGFPPTESLVEADFPL
jgi:hypothetical protein